jgi:hypothetical protein
VSGYFVLVSVLIKNRLSLFSGAEFRSTPHMSQSKLLNIDVGPYIFNFWWAVAFFQYFYLQKEKEKIAIFSKLNLKDESRF